MSKSIIDRIGAENIIRVCKESKTIKEAYLRLGCGYMYFVKAANELGCLEELRIRSKANGHHGPSFTKPWYELVENSQGELVKKLNYRLWAEAIFKGETFPSSHKLKYILLKSGLKEYKCENCGLEMWCGIPMPIQLHHIDGNHTNNSLENLQLLCPNCHALTDNFCGRNKGKRRLHQDKIDMYHLCKNKDVSVPNNDKHYCMDCGKELRHFKAQKRCRKCEAVHRRKYSDDMIIEMILECYNDGAFYRAYKKIGLNSEAPLRKIFRARGIPTRKSEFRKWVEENILSKPKSEIHF